jgi:hypothetical protein
MSFTNKKAELQQKLMLKMAYDNIALRRHIAELQASIKAVLDLHKEVNGPYDDTMCEHCFVDEYKYYEYPCPTLIQLIQPGYCIHEFYGGCEQCLK